MCISQLPQVMAASQTSSSLMAAETLSTLVATAWSKYISRLEITEPDLGSETVYTVTGETSSDTNKFCIQTINIQGGITDADKIMAIQDVIRKYEPDALAISEAGKHCKADTIKWLNKNMDENTSTNENKYLAASDADFPYTITSACTESEHERGGIVLLLHNKWRHRVVGKPVIDRNGRWVCTDIRTPRGRTSLIAAYLPPSPQTSTAAKLAWANLQDFVISRHAKNRLVYLFGDLNASANNPLHRHNTGPRHAPQDRLLSNLMEHGGLVDTFPVCNPSSQYKTWGGHDTWSSPDHILISTHTRQHATASQISNRTAKLNGLDHNLLTTYIDVDGSADIPKETRTHIHFDRNRTAEYTEALDAELALIPPDRSEEDTIHAFFAACIKVAKRLFSSTRRASPRSSARVLSIKNDIHAINIALHHTREGTPIPKKIRARTLFKDCDMSNTCLVDMKVQKRSELNSKSRKRAALTRHLHINRRSDHFTSGRLGPFLCSALSKYSTFRGVESVYNTVTGAVSSKPEEVRELTTARISSTFYSQRIPEPAHTRFTKDKDAWLQMPQWYRKTFANVKNTYVNPALANSMRQVSPSELRAALSRLGRNKSGGPSTLTAEMLIFASDSAQMQYILPFVNQSIINKNTPEFTKKFNVWLIEKTKGVGPIMHPTNKLDVRPISLFEVSFKLVETILATRINDALAPKLHPAQHAFNALRSVVDAITTYTLIMEDARQHKKEIHISNNDCTQAYDAVPPWAMYATYRYHGFPPDLIQMLINMDENMRGRVLTAHGAGTEWTKTCGLGQGSVLAPLKWNLFLDPLLHMLESTSDPYIMSHGSHRIEIRVLAFADDTTIFASSHKGYLERMSMAGEFFGIFGVNFSPQKTNYTYANTGGRHYKSAPIQVRNPDGTTTTQPSSVTSPHKPLRYLGAWLSPTLNWLPAKRKLRDEVTKILTILRHKSLSPEEFKYTIQSVLHSKLRYYLAVVPLLDTELDDIDRRIAHIMKKRMHMATSCSSPLLFLPEAEYGTDLPSIKDTRATSLIATAHSLLNDRHSILGRIIRMRLSHLQDSLGWAENPLSTPHLIPKNAWNNHWCARIGILLNRHNATITDTHGALTTTGKRTRDTSLHTLFSRRAYTSAKSSLKKHGLRWLGQVTNPQGTKLTNRTATGNHVSSLWWKVLTSKVTSDANGTLYQPISPTTSPIARFVPTHNPGTVATSYSKNPYTGVWEHSYYKITDSHVGQDGRESCYVTQLYPCTSKLLYLHRGVRRRRITSTQGTPLFKGDNNTVEYASALYPVPCTWARVTPTQRYPLNVALIHDSCTINTRQVHLHGDTTQLNLDTIAQAVRDCHCPQTGEYQAPEAAQHTICQLCDLPAADTKCSTPNCSLAVHTRCTTHQEWTCHSCTPDKTKVMSLHPSHLAKLETRALTHQIYSASDGSVKKAGTDQASSTFGVVIDHNHTNVRRYGKINIRKGEESSLRVELEALIHAYSLIPTHIHTIHAADNETAIAIHNELATSGLPPHRALMQLPYHSTIVRLHSAMQKRTRFLDIVHTLSHLEHEHTDDTDLKTRRDALARADKQADDGHQTSSFITDPSGVEDFALRIKGELVEKTATSPFAHIQSKRRMMQLYSRTLEGANHRAGPTPGWKTGSRQWPTFLKRFRHKLLTQRLPTAQNRAKRGDPEDGVPVNLWCPLCLAKGSCVQETHDHLLTCPHSAREQIKLLRKINNDFKQYYNPTSLLPMMDSIVENDILDRIAQPHSTTEAWTSHTTDKHGRKTPLMSGTPGRVYGTTKRITSWAQNILRHCDSAIHPQHHKEYIDSVKPYNSLDPHLLQGIAQAIQATTIHDTIPHNPFIPTTTLPITTTPQGDLPTVINASGNEVDWRAISEHLTDNRPWVLIADDTQLLSIAEHIPGPALTTIPPDSISLWNRSFWEGRSGLFPATIDSATTIFASPAVTALQRVTILDTIYMRSLEGGQLSTQPHITPHTLTQETPPSISTLLSHPSSSAGKLQLLSGYITKDITDSWEGIIPTRLHQKLYRSIHKTITLHQHGVWLHRNSILHPQVDVYIPVDYGRTQAHKRTLPEEEEANPRDKQWKRQREAAFTRQRMWAGTPIPKPTKKRKRTLITPQPVTDTDGSSTEEWPSHASNDSESDLLPTESPSLHTLHKATTNPPSTRDADVTSTSSASEVDSGKRNHARPKKKRASTSPTEHPSLNPTKRKRQPHIQIRRPSRPRKQSKGPLGSPQEDQPTQESSTRTYNRRSIEQLTAYIHSTRHTITTESRQRHGNEGVKDGAVSGTEGAGKTAPRVHGASGEDRPTLARTTDTQHASPRKGGRSIRTVQWTHTTPPPPSIVGRFRGRSPATPTLTTATHNNTPIHITPAQQKTKHTSSNTQPQGRRSTTQ